VCARPRGLVWWLTRPGDSNGYGALVPLGVSSDKGGEVVLDPSLKRSSLGTARLERFADRGVGGPRRAERSDVLDMLDEERCREAIVMSGAR
jgi:hypothetical protein